MADVKIQFNCTNTADAMVVINEYQGILDRLGLQPLRMYDDLRSTFTVEAAGEMPSQAHVQSVLQGEPLRHFKPKVDQDQNYIEFTYQHTGS